MTAIDLTRPGTTTVLRLSWPLILVFLFQNTSLAAITAMMGQLGVTELAGVGIGNVLFFIFLALFFGLDAGVQAITARHTGAGQTQAARSALADGLSASLTGGILFCAVISFIASPLLHGTVSSSAAASGTRYIMAALPALLLSGLNLTFSAYWNGTGRPAFSLLSIAAQVPITILSSYVLVFGVYGLPELKEAGAGSGMVLGTGAGLLVHLAVFHRTAGIAHLLRLVPARHGIAEICRIGFPISLQQALLYVGTLVFLSIIASMSEQALAAVNVISVLMLLSILPATGVGIAAATLTGSALGAGKSVVARQWGWYASTIGAFIVLPVSLVILAAPQTALGLFSGQRATIEVATLPLQLVAAAMSLDAFGRVLCFALRGVGATHVAALVPFGFQWILLLPLTWLASEVLGYGLAGIFALRLALTALETASYCFVWHYARWHTVSVGKSNDSLIRP